MFYGNYQLLQLSLMAIIFSVNQTIRMFHMQLFQGCWTEKRGTFGDYNCDAPGTLIKVKEYKKPKILNVSSYK